MSLGSGVIVGAGGVIVTNNHVIEHASRIAITTAAHRRLPAALVGTDPVTDIAVVRVDAAGLPTLPGINTAIYSETGGYQGIGFAVPANLARLVVDPIVAHGRVVRGTVGITRVADVNEDTLPGGGDQQGVLVVEMLRNSAADRAGVEPGDVVLAVQGRPVESTAQLRNELARAAVGSRLRLMVARGRRRLEITVPVEEAHPGA